MIIWNRRLECSGWDEYIQRFLYYLLFLWITIFSNISYQIKISNSKLYDISFNASIIPNNPLLVFIYNLSNTTGLQISLFNVSMADIKRSLWKRQFISVKSQKMRDNKTPTKRYCLHYPSYSILRYVKDWLASFYDPSNRYQTHFCSLLLLIKLPYHSI